MTKLLEDLDKLIATSAPSFHETLEAPATDAELTALRAEVGTLPDDVVAWFGWHAGSLDGFLPGTPFGIPTIQEAIAEIRFVRSVEGSPELAATTFVPLLTGRDGYLMYYVVTV